MSNLETVIQDIRRDLFPIQDRDIFLALCVQQRLAEQTAKYDQEFDKFLNALNMEISYQEDLSSIARSLKNFSELIITLYDNLLESIQCSESHFQKFSTNLD